MKIIPYKAGSESAKALAEELGIARLKLEGSRWKGKAGDVVINWGTSRMGHPTNCRPSTHSLTLMWLAQHIQPVMMKHVTC